MKANIDRIKANGIVYPNLSYQIMSVLFKVHNLGYIVVTGRDMITVSENSDCLLKPIE